MSERRERSYDLKTFESTRKIFKEREKEREMSTRQREDNDGDDGKCVKIVGNSKKTSDLKSLKEMKEYLRSEFEKKTDYWEKNRGGTFCCLSGRCWRHEIVNRSQRRGECCG